MKKLIFLLVIFLVLMIAGIVIADSEACNAECISPSRGFDSGTCRISPASTYDPCYDQTPDYIVTNLGELDDAKNNVDPGDLVCIRGGTYRPTSSIRFRRSGTSTNPIIWGAYRGEKVIFDGSDATLEGLWDSIIYVSANWNNFRNIEIRNSPGRGILVYEGDDNIFSHIETHHNGETGIYVDNGDRNQLLYIISHHNVDYVSPRGRPGDNADGISFSEGTENIVYGCLLYENSDDGIDTWDSTNNIIENCIAHSNGLLEYGNGNGFKLGGGSTTGGNRVTNCIAYNNRANPSGTGGRGFTNNQGCNNIIDHCTSYNNERSEFVNTECDNTLTNNIGRLEGNYDPTDHHNTWNLGISDPGFISTDPSSDDFLSLHSDSPCRGVASDGSDLGALQYGEKINDLIEWNGGCLTDEVDIGQDSYCTYWKTCCCYSTPTDIPTSDLVGYWKFNENSGTTASDSSGNNNHGTLYGGLGTTGWTSDCKYGSCLRFDGVDDYVDCGNGQSLVWNGDITVSIWIKPDSNQPVDWNIPVTKHDYGDNRGFWLEEGYQGNHQPKFAVANGASWTELRVSSGDALEPGKWYHLVGVAKTNEYVKVYVNGIEKASTTLVGEYKAHETMPLRFSRTNYPYKGIIDDVKIWNRVLGAEEIGCLHTDITGDGQVDITDVATVAKAFGSYPGHSKWNPIADITGPGGIPDDKVDMRDVALVATKFGMICPGGVLGASIILLNIILILAALVILTVIIFGFFKYFARRK